MIFNILVIGLVLGLAYAWMVRGFFNAFIHLLCVLVAGALAFAVWEPATYAVMAVSPERGFLSFIESAAWGVGLILPFCVFLLLARLLTDRVVSANLRNSNAADYAGGAVCGLGIGVITAGITVIGLQGLRLPTDNGYRPVWYTEDRAAGAGSLVDNQNLWIPADRIVAGLYANLSEGSMSVPESLAKWRPDLELAGFAARISPGDGAGRNVIHPDHFDVVRAYAVGTPERPLDANELLAVAGSSTPQRYVGPDGERAGRGRLLGFVVRFGPEAKERGKRGGQVITSNGQVQLVARDEARGRSVTLFPLAAISEGADADGRLGRWLFDANDVFISSVGGQSEATMAFEFLVPEGYQPIALNVRQTRAAIADLEPEVLASTAERDARVAAATIFTGGSGGTAAPPADRDDSNAVTIEGQTSASAGSGSGLRVGNTIGEMLSSQTARSRVTLDDENRIADGQAKFSIDEIGRSNVPAGRTMRVDSFALGRNQTMVQLDVSAGMPASLLSEAARLAESDRPLTLIDTNGNEYRAIGFVYKDREIFEIRYTLGNTLRGVDDTPPISTARDDQRLTLLFVVTTDAKIAQFAIGDVVVANVEPPLTAK